MKKYIIFCELCYHNYMYEENNSLNSTMCEVDEKLKRSVEEIHELLIDQDCSLKNNIYLKYILMDILKTDSCSSVLGGSKNFICIEKVCHNFNIIKFSCSGFASISFCLKEYFRVTFLIGSVIKLNDIENGFKFTYFGDDYEISYEEGLNLCVRKAI